jgi:hypothetical protein
LFKHPGYIADPFDRQQQVEKQEHELWKSKIKQEVMFKSMSHGGGNFTKDKYQYGVDDKTKMLMNQKKTHYYGNYKRVIHEARFKPAGDKHGGPIGRYPPYEKPRERANTVGPKKVKTEADEDRNDWKGTYKGMSRPTPSISLMATNCRRYL